MKTRSAIQNGKCSLAKVGRTIRGSLTFPIDETAASPSSEAQSPITKVQAPA
jgi:hypothetical protein